MVMLRRLVDRVARWRAAGGALAQSNPLLHGGAGSALVQAGALGASLLLGVLLARGLGPAHYGVYAYAMAVLTLLLIGGEAGVPTLLMREVAVARAAGRWSAVVGDIRTGVKIVLLAAAALGGLGAGLVLVRDPAIASPQARTGLIMLAALPAVALAKVLAYALRGLGAVVRGHACEFLGRPALVLLAMTALFWGVPAWRQPEVAMLAQLLAAAVVAVSALYWIRQSLPSDLPTSVPSPPVGGWLKRAAPFALIGGALVLNNQTDIIMLGWFRSDAEVGAYRIAQQGGYLTLFVLQAAHSVLGPTFGQLYAHRQIEALRTNFRRAAWFVFAATVPLAAVLIAFARPIVETVFGSEYLLAAGPLMILVAGYLVNVAFGPVGLFLQMTGRERVTAWVLWATVALNAGLNAVLIPTYGVHGSALATAVSVVVYHGVLRAVSYRTFGV